MRSGARPSNFAPGKRAVEWYVRFIVRHRRAVVIAVLLITGLLAAQLRHLRLDLRRRAQLPQDHPYVRVQNQIADLFGGETTVVIGVIPKSGDIFEPKILEKIIRITHGLEALPSIVRSNLLSLAAEHVKAIRRTSDGMEVRPLLEHLPNDPAALAELKRSILGDPIYAGTLVARDGGAAAIVADFDGRLSDAQIERSVEAVVAPERDAQVDIALGGMPMVRAAMVGYMRDIAILFPIAVLVIGFVHYEAFRTWQAMFLPLVTALLSVVWALGFMGAVGEPMDTWGAITPVVILAIAAGHAVQILKRYYEEYARVHDAEEAVVRSVTAVGPLMLTAGLIAAAGFGSLVTFGVTTVRVFGLLLALGIVSALVIEMTFIPACRAMLPAPRRRETLRERDGAAFSAFIEWITEEALIHPYRILVVSLLLLAVSAVGATRLRVDNSLRAWFPENSLLRRDDRLLNDRLAGTSTLYLLLEGQSDGDLEDPRVLRAVSDLQQWLQREPMIGATRSLADFVKRMHRVMAGDNAAPNGIPENKRLIAQYLLLYSLSGPDDFNSLVDPAHRRGVLRAYAKSDKANFAEDLFERLNVFIAARFRGLPVRVHVGGGALGVQAALNEVVVHDKIVNVMQIALLIFALSALVLRSWMAGVMVLTPLVVAATVNLGIMGVTGTWLSIATASITAMGVSIGADFAIYLIFRIREELARAGGDLNCALRVSLQTSGKAILFVSSAVVFGYLVLALSGFRVWMYVGILTALMTALSSLGALTIIPAMIMLLRPRFLWRKVGQEPAVDFQHISMRSGVRQ
jgi:predicted RND superfamily exporter protein